MASARNAAFVALFLLGSSAPAWSQVARDARLTDREFAVHLLSRFGYGPEPVSLDQVMTLGPDKWLEQQVVADLVDGECKKRLAVWPFLAMDAKAILAEWNGGGNEMRRRFDQGLIGSIIVRAVENDYQVAEVTAEFWRNHFNVDRDKDSVRWLSVDWERSVIRRYVFSPFHDFLLASAQHPAMLVYLDNHVSRRPPSKTQLKDVARRVRRDTGSRERGEEAASIAAQNGLNENYARELLELHTLGVDNGYTQKDVIQVAEALTGWTVGSGENAHAFEYRDDMHVHGDKFVVGRSIRREKRRNGQMEGEAVIEYLAGHRNTADFVAAKLCTWFVADEPPASLVKSTARVLREKKFEIGAAIRHIARSAEFADPLYFRCKFKTPFEFVVSALRVTEAEIDDPSELFRRIGDMGQPIYQCDDPTGYRDVAESWRDPGVMAARWRFAIDLAHDRVKGVRLPPRVFDGMVGKPTAALIRDLTDRVLPGGVRGETIRVLMKMAQRQREQEASREPGTPAPSPLERRLLAALLGAPEFQEQ